ncbi:MAG: ABC transporter ATP-binding protein/permease [Candidatus Omnitrophica bacterium]|nr:ABC transporter ATP-binding protein/permease [Candidatus Omnitrophota bacterium]MCM8802332.1 ABC transporter ATP-binding protein/permease [Candidatus Omnitrophota bacterium]
MIKKNKFKEIDFDIFFYYLKNYKKAVILAPIFMILEVIMDLLQPKLLSRIVDEGIIKENLNLIINTGFTMLIIAVIGLIGGIGCTIFSSLASQNFGHDLRNDIFKKILNSKFKNITKFSPSSLITRLTNDVSQAQQLVLISLRMLVRAPFLCIGGIIMSFLINLKLSLIILVIIPCLLLIFYHFAKKSFNLFTIMQKKLDRLNLIIRENLAGIRVIKIFNRTDYEKNRFENANKELMRSSLEAINLIVKMGPIVMIIINLSIISVLWFGGKMFLNEKIKVGEIMAFINYLMIIFMSLMMISNLFIFISRAGASIERINEILKIPSCVKSKREKFHQTFDIRGKIEFKNVFFSYDGSLSKNYSLKNISFKVENGQTLGIVGTTGSGKTTLLNLIANLYQPTKGEILIDGINIEEIEPSILKNSIGFVTQDTLIFSGTIKEIMKWANENATDEEIIEALKVSQIYDFIKTLPDGLDTFIGQKGVNLSGGQKQRLTIARAILANPQILILDEATSNIDTKTEMDIQKSMLKLMEGRTSFVIAHRLNTIKNADLILVVNEGEIVEKGTHKELMEKKGFYYNLFITQFAE